MNVAGQKLSNDHKLTNHNVQKVVVKEEERDSDI